MARMPELGPYSTILLLARGDLLLEDDRRALERIGILEARLLELRPALIALRDTATRPGRHAARLVEEIDAACQASTGLLLEALRAVPWSTDRDAHMVHERACVRLAAVMERGRSLVEARRAMHEARDRLSAMLSRFAQEQQFAVDVLDLRALADVMDDAVELPLAQRTINRISTYERLLEDRSTDLARQTARLPALPIAASGIDREALLVEGQRASVGKTADRVELVCAMVATGADRHLVETPRRLEVARARASARRASAGTKGNEWKLLDLHHALAGLVRPHQP
jgi:hypothetical protein